MEAWAVVEDGHLVEAHNADRIVPWWSFTKTVLAAAALVLVRDGLATLDAPLPGRAYSLRHLLQHRSGVVNYGGLHAYHEAVERNDDPWPVQDLLESLDAGRLRYSPGEGWEYSNIGYLFVRQLIESVTGESLGTALNRLVLGPLGIRGARVAIERSDLNTVETGAARDYHPGWVYHGLLVGTVTDAALLLDRIASGGLLPQDLRDAMGSPFVLGGPTPGRPWIVPGYGLGVMTGETSSGVSVLGHTGGGPGSTIGVYRAGEGKPHRTAAYFMTEENQSETEKRTFSLLMRSQLELGSGIGSYA